MACTSCKKKITPKIMENTQFKLRSQITFAELALTNPSFKVGEVTDEIVLEFLKQNPNRISLFSEYPENWIELISDTPKVETIEIEAPEVIHTPISKDNKRSKGKGK